MSLDPEERAESTAPDEAGKDAEHESIADNADWVVVDESKASVAIVQREIQMLRQQVEVALKRAAAKENMQMHVLMEEAHSTEFFRVMTGVADVMRVFRKVYLDPAERLRDSSLGLDGLTSVEQDFGALKIASAMVDPQRLQLVKPGTSSSSASSESRLNCEHMAEMVKLLRHPPTCGAAAAAAHQDLLARIVSMENKVSTVVAERSYEIMRAIAHIGRQLGADPTPAAHTAETELAKSAVLREYAQAMDEMTSYCRGPCQCPKCVHASLPRRSDRPAFVVMRPTVGKPVHFEHDNGFYEACPIELTLARAGAVQNVSAVVNFAAGGSYVNCAVSRNEALVDGPFAVQIPWMGAEVGYTNVIGSANVSIWLKTEGGAGGSPLSIHAEVIDARPDKPLVILGANFVAEHVMRVDHAKRTICLNWPQDDGGVSLKRTDFVYWQPALQDVKKVLGAAAVPSPAGQETTNGTSAASSVITENGHSSSSRKDSVNDSSSSRKDSGSPADGETSTVSGLDPTRADQTTKNGAKPKTVGRVGPGRGSEVGKSPKPKPDTTSRPAFRLEASSKGTNAGRDSPKMKLDTTCKTGAQINLRSKYDTISKSRMETSPKTFGAKKNGEPKRGGNK